MDELFLRNESNLRRISPRSCIAQQNELKVAFAYATAIMQLRTWKSIVRWAQVFLYCLINASKRAFEYQKLVLAISYDRAKLCGTIMHETMQFESI